MAALSTAMTDGVIAVYDGVQPSSADAVPNGTFIGYVTKDGNAWTDGDTVDGLEFEAAAAGVLAKSTSQTWRLTADVGLSGTATARWARFIQNTGEDGSSSTTLKRIDFAVGITTGELRLTSVDFSAGQTADVTSFTITQDLV
jgi:hypothetical protein